MLLTSIAPVEVMFIPTLLLISGSKGFLPTDTRTLSTTSSPPVVIKRSLSFSPFTSCNSVRVLTAMPFLTSSFLRASDTSLSISGKMLAIFSIMVTLLPKVENIEANSTPITPPPIIAISVGSSVKDNISVLVKIPSPSKPFMGGITVVAPVAIMILFVLIIFSPSPVFTKTLFLSIMLPMPWITFTPFVLSNCFTPMASLLTILSFLFIIC